MKNVFLVLCVLIFTSCGTRDENVYLMVFRNTDGNLNIAFAKDSLLLDEKKDFLEFKETDMLSFVVDSDKITFTPEVTDVIKQNSTHFDFAFFSEQEWKEMTHKDKALYGAAFHLADAQIMHVLFKDNDPWYATIYLNDVQDTQQPTDKTE